MCPFLVHTAYQARGGSRLDGPIVSGWLIYYWTAEDTVSRRTTVVSGERAHEAAGWVLIRVRSTHAPFQRMCDTASSTCTTTTTATTTTSSSIRDGTRVVHAPRVLLSLVLPSLVAD